MNPQDTTGAASEPAGKSLTNVGDRSLTLAAKKLAGSPRCLNCGTELQGPFCYFCGQPDRNFMRFFPVLLRDFMEDLLDLDSRFMRTIKPLLFRPGRLTRDYMAGKRFRYAPPMRLYIFSSLLFFLLAAFLSSDAIDLSSSANTDGIIHITADTEEERQAVDEALAKLPRQVRENVTVDQNTPGEEDDDGSFELGDIQFNDEPWDRETNPVDIAWLPDSLNDRINDEIEGSPQKAEQLSQNPNLFIDKIFDILPAAMFVLLPVVALIFKFWYLFAKRYYIEHLIFSLHNHAFLFVVLILMLLVGLIEDVFIKYEHANLAAAAEWLGIIISLWIPVYLLISLRVVYQQSWALTIGKYFAIGFSYVSLLVVVSTGVAIASFVLL